MSDQPTIRDRVTRNLRVLVALFTAMACIGVLDVWWMTSRADRDMREELLQQARLVAQTVGIAGVKTLSGTEADLTNPEYQRIKEKFAGIKQANRKYRFVYLLGRKPDGTVFIFVDNESPESEDYSPPGQVYEEVPEEDRLIFERKVDIATGPEEDRWGTWVSALVPLIDPATGDVVAVLAWMSTRAPGSWTYSRGRRCRWG